MTFRRYLQNNVCFTFYFYVVLNVAAESGCHEDTDFPAEKEKSIISKMFFLTNKTLANKTIINQAIYRKL